MALIFFSGQHLFIFTSDWFFGRSSVKDCGICRSYQLAMRRYVDTFAPFRSEKAQTFCSLNCFFARRTGKVPSAVAG